MVNNQLVKCLLLLCSGKKKVLFVLQALVKCRNILRVDWKQLGCRLVMSMIKNHRGEVSHIVKIKLLGGKRWWLHIDLSFWNLLLKQLGMLFQELLFHLFYSLRLVITFLLNCLKWHLEWIMFLWRHPLILLLKIVTLPAQTSSSRRDLIDSLILSFHNLNLLFSSSPSIWHHTFILFIILYLDFLMNRTHHILPLYLICRVHGLTPIWFRTANNPVISSDCAFSGQIWSTEPSHITLVEIWMLICWGLAITEATWGTRAQIHQTTRIIIVKGRQKMVSDGRGRASP